jgi:ABC-2 type transport system ATP-binding protein/lipopolysaccharide transport system ATP-binding protein
MRSEAATHGNGAMPSVAAVGLGKHYNLGELTSLRRTLSRLRGGSSAPPQPGLEALAGVDFMVARGEAVGIVGSNGSGKSTLLQILAGTTLPTRGEMRVFGSVLPLLAVGLGFHPELTGRENVTLFAASLGIPTKMIVDRMDDITAFAELERHMDTPVKRFSSGMMSRLSFAIAVQIPADIYIFDEVLAVVDAEYQQRCLAEIKRIHADGRTIFFVSHHREQVEEVCDRVLWLDAGVVRDFGPTSRVLADYDEEARLSA